MFNIGDKVKFLNAPGGGVVSKIIDSRMVSILMEDGFEIPTLISELIRMEPGNPAGRFFEEKFKVALKPEIPENNEADEDRSEALPVHLARDRKSEDIYLAFIPHDQKWMITGPVDICLVNNSPYDVLYNIFTKTPLGHYEGVDYGSMFPDSKVVVRTINREQLTHWSEGCIQFLFHRDQCQAVPPPFNAGFFVEGKKFFKEGSYREHSVIRSKGIVMKVLSLSSHFGNQSEEPSELKSDQTNSQISSIIDKHRVAPREAVVDLHIHELVDDPSNLEKSEIIHFQVNYFIKCLNAALSGHYMKVVFIHGVGNGVLRSAILDELKKHEGIEFFDAPMAQYGVGALEVRIPHNVQSI